MITFILGLVSAVLLLLLLWIGSAGGFAFWLMQLSKRPGVLIFYPGGKTVLRPLAKDEEHHSHIELKKENLAYLKTPGSLLRINDKISVYVVYAPVGETLKPEYIKAMEIVRKEGYETVADLLREYSHIVEHEYEPAYYTVTEAMARYGVKDATKLLQRMKDRGAPEEEIARVSAALDVLAQYRKVKMIVDNISPWIRTMSPEEVRPLASTISADYIHRLLANARTEARISMLEEIQKLLKNRHTEIILGLIVLAIVVVVLVLNPGSGGHAVTQAAQNVAQKVVEANVGGGIHM